MNTVKDAALILIVDDDAKSRALMSVLWKADGYEIAHATTGAEALEEATRRAPDVILLDIMMPDMDGLEVCRHLRLDPILAEVHIIMITGLNDPASRLRGLEAGADDFITKPVDVLELRTRVRNVVHMNRYRKLFQERTRAQRAEADVLASSEATLRALVRILERNGSALPGRCDRVMGLAMHLGAMLKASDAVLSSLRWSTLLQTIGAMSSPRGLRNDAGSVTLPEEEEQECKHARWIIEALSSIAVLNDALQVFSALHENWDGTGRPRGLKGDEIPLAARILAVALAWEMEMPLAPAATSERLALLKTRCGGRLDPAVYGALEHIMTAPQELPADPIPCAPVTAAPAPESRPHLSPFRKFSMTSAGTRAQFVVALALITVIPTLLMIYLCMSGLLGFQLAFESLWPIVVITLPFEVLGYWMLAKYPVNVIRLRRYLESLTAGDISDNVALVADDDDLASIETLMRKVIKQTEMRISTIETQTAALLDAERQRVMIQSLGAACHHLGQPATVIGSYLQMMSRMDMPEKAQSMLVECRAAADAVASVLERLQRLTVYRTEPYLVESEKKSTNQACNDIITM